MIKRPILLQQLRRKKLPPKLNQPARLSQKNKLLKEGSALIRKFLVCGKQHVYVQSKRLDSFAELGHVIELVMPIEVCWQLESTVQEIDYLIAAGEAAAEIAAVQRRAFHVAAPYAVREVERKWLYEKSKT